MFNKSYRVNNFESGNISKLLILGKVGSGKTTLSKKLSQKYGVKVLSIDDAVNSRLLKDRKLRDRLKKANDIKALKANYKKNSEAAINDLLDKKGRYIIEGNQLYTTDRNLGEYAAIDIRTPKFISDRRVAKREGYTKDEIKSILKRKREHTNHSYK